MASGPARRATIGMAPRWAPNINVCFPSASTSYHDAAPTPAHGASSLQPTQRGSRPRWMASPPCSSSSSCWPSRSTTSTASTTRPTRSRPRSRPGRSRRATRSSWRPPFNFIGAFAGTAVAKTIASGLVDEATTTQVVIAAALIGAIAWNLITWQQGLPSSSSHALIGGLLGATIVGGRDRRAQHRRHRQQGAHPDVHLAAARVLHRLRVDARALLDLPIARSASRWRGRFRRLQVGSAAFMAFAHGSNDAQKTMGIITLALLSAGRHRRRSRSRPGSSSCRRPRSRSGPRSAAGGS